LRGDKSLPLRSIPTGAYLRNRKRFQAAAAVICAVRLYGPRAKPKGIPPAFEDVAAEWASADVARRRHVLGQLFEGLYINDREVVGYEPRPEYGEEVASVMGLIKAHNAKYLVPPRGRRRTDLQGNAERERFGPAQRFEIPIDPISSGSGC
jgi:hypothetical protein